MLSRARANPLLLGRGPGYEHWLVDGRDGETGIPLALASRVLARALGERAVARAVGEMLGHDEAERGCRGDLLWRRVEPWLTSGRLVVVERERALPSVRSDHRPPEQIEPPTPVKPEPILIDDAPSLTRTVALVVLDFDGDGEHVVNLPLFVDHRNGRIDSGRTNSSGKLEVRQLPADHRWSVFSGRNPDAVR